ncbi:MAG: hypothetical protein KGL43_11120 [Burkholderiales bacterium]|nr:hypothetical protein [Burkholderiales bacterium]MDE2454133.1 hypothetical protein [Burkholderiales bacterium]
MERLLVLRLESSGCEAEAVLNGVPLARVGAACAAVTLPVHEFTLAGANEVELVIEPGPATAPAEPQPRIADGRAWARLQLLLPRVGSAAHPASARNLAQLDWAAAAGELFEAPLGLRAGVELPISFPRWRWLDAPAVADAQALKKDVAAYLLPIAVGLARGDPEPLVQATRLRLEDLASAYQLNLADEVGRLRLHIQQLHAAQPLAPELPAPAKLRLRPVAGGRLLECLNAAGEPFLQSGVAGGGRAIWPLRLAAVDGRFYVLR